MYSPEKETKYVKKNTITGILHTLLSVCIYLRKEKQTFATKGLQTLHSDVQHVFTPLIKSQTTEFFYKL